MKVTAVVGSYRKGGIVDSAIDEILSSAREVGAEVSKIYLMDRHIEFCRNCRTCTQEKGLRRGACPVDDDMGPLLDELEKSDAIVLGSPMNFGTVTAVMKRFIERLVCFAYWPWGGMSPTVRDRRRSRKAVIVITSAAPAFMARMQRGMVKLLKDAAGLLGADTVGVLSVGLAARKKKQTISKGTAKKARLLGRKLLSDRSR